MVPDKFNMVDMEGIDILFSYGDVIPGLYQKLVESIAQCRYQCLYNWYFDGVLIPPTYVEMTVNQDTNDIWINDGVFVNSYDCMSFYLPSLETVSGSVINITDALSRKAKELICYVNPFQTGSGDPSPDNIRPISGWALVNIYNEETYDVSATPKLTINWQTEAGTIYGGSVTLNEDGSADVVADKAGYDMGDFNYGVYYASVPLFGITLANMPIIMDQQFDGWIYCSCFKPMYGTSLGSIGANIQNNQIMGRNTYRELYIKDTRFTDPADFKDAVAGQILVVPLENPITYHFDTIDSLYIHLGTNIIWHDANGDISVTYWKQ